MKLTQRKRWKPWLILVPFLLGVIGFLDSGDPLLQSIYHSLCLYGMGHQGSPANIVIEIARWLAPLATAGSVVLAVTALRRRFRAMVARCTGESVAVYGPETEKQAMLERLKNRGIDMDKQPVKAHNYILLGSEQENLEFYRAHLACSDKAVYLKCTSLPAQASDRANLHLFCPEETASRLFWQKYCPCELSAANDHQLNIALLGFGKLGQEVLLTALQNNIFDASQHIEYHVFGRENGFSKVYHQLDQISDPVIFHEDPWQNSLEQITGMHMIIVAEQENQHELLRSLILSLPGKEIHVLCAQPEGVSMLAAQYPLACFEWKQVAMRPEHILSDRLFLYAKRINLRYARLYEGVEETTENRDRCWSELDTFTRYSNISAADYHAVQLRLLGEYALTEEKLEWLAELEHIRWCRYHYLNNWAQGTPENGKNKDAVKRVHKMLIPYVELAEKEKEKDRENIRILMKLDRDVANGILN